MPASLPQRFARTRRYYELRVVETFGEAFGDPSKLGEHAMATLIAYLNIREAEEQRLG